VPSYLALIQNGPNAAPEILPLGRATTVDSLIRLWSEAAANEPPPGSREGKDSFYQRRGEALRRAVWDPIAARLSGARRVFIVPDSTLHLVNFAALPAADGRYLVESGPLLHYLSAERDLATATESGTHGNGLLVLGGADFDAGSPAAPGSSAIAASTPATEPDAPSYRGARSACGTFQTMLFPPLPGTLDEANEIAAMWAQAGAGAGAASGRIVSLSGAAATREALLRNAPGCRVLHIATHGFFLGRDCGPPAPTTSGATADRAPAPAGLEDNPLLLSGLALAGANRHAKGSANADDGILTAEEIASLDLHGVDWVVLSACETGVGSTVGSEGVLGLRRAFQVAGARTLVLSLWSVEDRATREWMSAFYASRLKRGLGAAEAVRAACTSTIASRRERGESAHPFYWAGFVATGDWK
jgi:CHAT domain-containing protein